jgi:hypothetical protein
MKIIICSNHKEFDYFKKKKNKTINIKNFKERNILVKTKKCNEFELIISDDNNKIIKLYNYVPLFKELYKYFPLIKKTNINYSLYSNDNPDKSEKVSFKNEEEAIKSIEKIKKKSYTYQVKVILTLYNRAKYHPHQTSDMRKAMLIFSKWLIKNKK